MKEQVPSPARSSPQLQTKTMNEAYDRLIVDKFAREGFSILTAIQKKALPVIARKVNCLLVAPTGSGKTEAAVMPVFTMLSHSKGEAGMIRAIYITPLRALNNDVLRRIVRYAESEGLRVEIRHGDTTAAAKRKIVDNPPDILITTPESLAVVLTSEKMLAALKALEYVIVDEVHELVPSERGSHLSLSLERLQAVSESHVTRIGLSATVGNLKQAAQFVSGAGKRHAVLVDTSARGYDIDVKYVKGSLNNVAHF